MSSACSDFLPGRSRPAPAVLELLARRFAALAQPLRLKLIRALLAGEKPVDALVAETGGTPTNVSRQLQALHRAGVLARRKDGRRAYYGLADQTIIRLCELTCGSIQEQLHAQMRILRR